jgi:hypothetical protein
MTGEDAEDITVASLRATLQAAGYYVDPIDFADFSAIAFLLGKDIRTVQRMVKRGDFLPNEVRSRHRSRRISLAGFVRWHLDGLIPESHAA